MKNPTRLLMQDLSRDKACQKTFHVPPNLRTLYRTRSRMNAAIFHSQKWSLDLRARLKRRFDHDPQR